MFTVSSNQYQWSLRWIYQCKGKICKKLNLKLEAILNLEKYLPMDFIPAFNSVEIQTLFEELYELPEINSKL
jgi:hypothetical protein